MGVKRTKTQKDPNSTKMAAKEKTAPQGSPDSPINAEVTDLYTQPQLSPNSPNSPSNNKTPVPKKPDLPTVQETITQEHLKNITKQLTATITDVRKMSNRVQGLETTLIHLSQRQDDNQQRTITTLAKTTHATNQQQLISAQINDIGMQVQNILTSAPDFTTILHNIDMIGDTAKTAKAQADINTNAILQISTTKHNTEVEGLHATIAQLTRQLKERHTPTSNRKGDAGSSMDSASSTQGILKLYTDQNKTKTTPNNKSPKWATGTSPRSSSNWTQSPDSHSKTTGTHP